MSQEEIVSRKARKAQRDAERHRKGKRTDRAKRDQERRPEIEQQNVSDDAAEQHGSVKSAAKNARKRKAAEEQDEGVTVEDTASAADQPKSKKRKKSSIETADDPNDGPTAADKPQKPTKSRFIVFVGNLPFKTTDDSLRIHFKKLEPFTLRHRTDPKTKKSKGFAFLEFENYDRMKTCLKLYHHSMFDPADPTKGEDQIQEDTGKRGKKSNARKINVELTAGGGGKTEGRQAKIKAKNVKLEEERKRRAEAERKESARKEKKESGKAKRAEKDERAGADADTTEGSQGIHPSRLARINA